MPEVRQYVEIEQVFTNSKIEFDNRIKNIMARFANKGLKSDIEYQATVGCCTGSSCYSAVVRGYKSWQQGEEGYKKFFEKIKG